MKYTNHNSLRFVLLVLFISYSQQHFQPFVSYLLTAPMAVACCGSSKSCCCNASGDVHSGNCACNSKTPQPATANPVSFADNCSPPTHSASLPLWSGSHFKSECFPKIRQWLADDDPVNWYLTDPALLLFIDEINKPPEC